MEFRSQENKQILYQILSSHPLKSINEGRFASAIEAQVNLVYKERFKFKNALVEMNKEIIRRFQIIAMDIEKQMQQQQQQQSQQQSQQQHRNQQSQSTTTRNKCLMLSRNPIMHTEKTN